MTTHRTRALVRLNLTLLAREPGPVISRIVAPIVLIALLKPLYANAFGDAAGTTQTVAGILVMFSLLSMSIAGTAILAERFWHTADRLRASPARPLELLAGKAVPILAVFLTQQSTILVYGYFVLGLHIATIPLLAGTILVWGSTLLCVGSALGTWARSGAGLSAMVDISSLVLTGIGGAFVPLDLLPPWARALAPISPGYWAMRTLRASLDGNVPVALTGWLVLLAVAAAGAGLTAHRLRQGWGRTTPG